MIQSEAGKRVTVYNDKRLHDREVVTFTKGRIILRGRSSNGTITSTAAEKNQACVLSWRPRLKIKRIYFNHIQVYVAANYFAKD